MALHPSNKSLRDGAVQFRNEDEHGETRMTRAKWLACVALCLSYTTSYQQNACTSAIVKAIDEKLGPTTYYNWMLSSYTIAVSVSLPLSGGLSDIFGRRNFVIVGCCISLVGTAIALGSQNVPMLIAAMILKGIGSGSQQLSLAAIGEIVPNNQRGNAQAALDIVTMPWAVFGSLTGQAMVAYHTLGFRINFIIGAILNCLSILTIWLWYSPPRPKLAGNLTVMQRVGQLDWTGIILMAFGIVLFLVGIGFGGEKYPWRSVGTIAPILAGFFCLVALGFWEWKLAKHPFFAHELFIGKGRTFPIFLIITFVGGMSLYAAAAFFVQQCQGMWVRDPIKIGVASIPGGVGGAIGGFLGGYLMGKHRFLGSKPMLLYGIVTKIIADGIFTTLTPNDFHLAMGMGFLAMFGVGFMLVALIVCTQLTCNDENIGLATLVLGAVRGMGGSVAITVFTSLIQNTLKDQAGSAVGKTVIPPPYSVPASSLPKMVKMIIGGQDAAAAKLPGSSPEAVAAARQALKWVWGHAFQRIYYVTLGFTFAALLAALFVRDVTHNMTANVAVTLENDGQNRRRQQQMEMEKEEGMVEMQEDISAAGDRRI